MAKYNAVIGQSGGPTSVINASLAGAIQACLGWKELGTILGMRYGIEGFMAENIIDLGQEPQSVLSGLLSTPSSALGSCRHKVKDVDLPKIFEVIKKYDIRYVFLIGGNDTMDTIHRVSDYAAQHKYELTGIGIPKTVDNDLFGTDHTPGFASAAKYMAMSVQQAGVLARDMQKVDQFVVFQTIGREAGWLAAATTLGRTNEDDAPHLLCLPERAFDQNKFLKDVENCYKRYGFVSIVCGEGCKYADGTPVSASQIKDKFNNTEFGAMAGTSVAMVLHKMIANEFGFRGEFQITESLSMCAADRAIKQDIDEAVMCGKAAVELAAKGETGKMVTLVREAGPKYVCTTGTAALKEVAVHAKPMPDAFINSEGNGVTKAFEDYARPLVGEMPKYVRLSNIRFR